MSVLIRKATPKDLPLNEPIKFAIYDADQRLLLRSGYVITIPGFSDRLIGRGCYVGYDPKSPPESEPPAPASQSASTESRTAPARAPETLEVRKEAPPNVFQAGADLTIANRRQQRQMLELTDPIAGLADSLQQRAKKLLQLLQTDRDAALAACILHSEAADNRAAQQVLGAAVAALLAAALKLGADEQCTLVKAGLTRGLGLLSLDRSYGQVTPLPEQAQEKLRSYPLTSVSLLQQHGVHDSDWLKLVRQHHERLDGSGYPAGLSGSQIDPRALLLGLADAYAGMVLSNPRRAGLAPPISLKLLMGVKNKEFDEQHIALLVRTVGLYPPGVLVKLASHETAVVKTSASPRHAPLVYAFYDRDGLVRSTPLLRDTNQSEYAITDCVAPENCLSAKLVIRRLWAAPAPQR